MKNERIEMIAGIDLGNGYVKGKCSVSGHEYVIDMPATVGYVVKDTLPAEVNPSYIEDIVNNLEVDITSKCIKTLENGRVYTGNRAIKSGSSTIEFDIESPEPKCNTSLSAMLVLSGIASSAVRYLYNKSDNDVNFFDNLGVVNVDVYLGVALPIEDFMEYKDTYKNNLMKDSHVVCIHNFEKDITLNINFKSVGVIPEGASGQYAISIHGAKDFKDGKTFLDVAVEEMKKQGLELEGYTGEILHKAHNTIGIDVGEGTVNFPVFIDKRSAIESSSSIKKGYGTVLTDVVTDMRNTNNSFANRKDLAQFMEMETVSPRTNAIKALLQKSIDKYSKVLIKDIVKEFNKIYKKVGNRTEVVYIYGGGSTKIKDLLYQAIVESTKGEDGIILPVVYIDERLSRTLNRDGLFILAQSVYKESKK